VRGGIAASLEPKKSTKSKTRGSRRPDWLGNTDLHETKLGFRRPKEGYQKYLGTVEQLSSIVPPQDCGQLGSR